MSIYINKGSLKGTSDYLLIKGKRVYTGEEFEATEKDIKKLEKLFNIKPKTKTKKAAKSTQPDPKISESIKKSESSKSTRQSFSGINFKTTNSDEGVK